ncbi:MAG: hypothetical protein WCT53_05895 [Candidatus Gracilibacteria bacterium]|jgi:hypothetical protein
MNIPYKIYLKKAPQCNDYWFALGFPKELICISAIIIDAGSINGERELLDFINEIVINRNVKNEYWTNGYTARVVEQDGKKMIKVFFRLTNDYEPSYITPEDFKELLEIWIHEREEFEKDPEEYKEKLRKTGGIVEE